MIFIIKGSKKNSYDHSSRDTSAKRRWIVGRGARIIWKDRFMKMQSLTRDVSNPRSHKTNFESNEKSGRYPFLPFRGSTKSIALAQNIYGRPKTG